MNMSIPLIQHTRFLLISNGVRTLPRRLGYVWCRPISSSRKISMSQLQLDNGRQSVEESIDIDKVRVLKQKMELIGINCASYSSPGMYDYMFCPQCKGGRSLERSLSIHISQDGDFAMWRCFLSSCGWAGRVHVDDSKIKSPGEMTEKYLRLEPLGEKLLAYFGKRKISEETLKRNGVMQKCDDQEIIAFTYRQNGALVGCKYRSIDKRFWQEKDTKKWLYGLDDIHEASEIIIVEGEIDKLSLEEAGFRNCISVPGGAPQKVSSRKLPELEKDTGYQYIWNNRECLDKVSRIILATDGDAPGQALAEELARRLGKERCWRVRWPKKDDSMCFKDSNEVLMYLGSVALTEIIENAEPYPEGT